MAQSACISGHEKEDKVIRFIDVFYAKPRPVNRSETGVNQQCDGPSPRWFAVSPQVGTFHGVPPGEEFHQPGEHRWPAVCRGRLRHGSDGEQGGGSHRGHRCLAVSPQ